MKCFQFYANSDYFQSLKKINADYSFANSVQVWKGTCQQEQLLEQAKTN